MLVSSRGVFPHIHIIAWHLPEIHRQFPRRHLVPLRVGADSFKVFTYVLSVEVYKGVRMRSIDPNTSEDASVDSTHKPLANYVETVCWFKYQFKATYQSRSTYKHASARLQRHHQMLLRPDPHSNHSCSTRIDERDSASVSTTYRWRCIADSPDNATGAFPLERQDIRHPAWDLCECDS